jgi:hypothetical protein
MMSDQWLVQCFILLLACFECMTWIWKCICYNCVCNSISVYCIRLVQCLVVVHHWRVGSSLAICTMVWLLIKYNLLLMLSSMLVFQEGLGSKLGDLKVYSVVSSSSSKCMIWMHFLPAYLCILCEAVFVHNLSPFCEYFSLCHFVLFPQPTFHFYYKGEKTGELVGADAKKLEVAMESLHK